MCNAGSNSAVCGGRSALTANGALITLSSRCRSQAAQVRLCNSVDGMRRIAIGRCMVAFLLSMPLAASRTKSADSDKALPPQIIAYIFPRDRALQPSRDRGGEADPYQLRLRQYPGRPHRDRQPGGRGKLRDSRRPEAAKSIAAGAGFGGRLAVVGKLLRHGAHQGKPKPVHRERGRVRRPLQARRARHRLGVSRDDGRRQSFPS